MTGGIAPVLGWAAAALLLGLAELFVPGVFLIFLAVGAAVTAGIVAAVPDLPLAAALASFGMWSSVAVLVGRRWYRDYAVDTDDPLLNDRAARLIGTTARLDTAIEQGRGRVRVADGSWPAAGPDLPAGTTVRIVAVDGGVVVIEPA